MNRHFVAAHIAERATRFGDRNPQQLEQLSERLGKLNQEEVLHGILQVFSQGEAPPEGSRAQELAGALLARLRPQADFDLDSLLRQAIPRYELSVEEFPQYLAEVCGTATFLAALERIEQEDLPPIHRRALKTMRFWVRNQSSSEPKHDEA
jgi:hypothetical protein